MIGETAYFNKQQMYQHFKKKPKDGIYVYSFALNPLEFQPSGNCNFSTVEICFGNYFYP